MNEDRSNSEGVPRHQLRWILRRAEFVRQARKIDRCLLCCAARVNEAGLCEGCCALLDPEEHLLVERWRAGVGP